MTATTTSPSGGVNPGTWPGKDAPKAGPPLPAGTPAPPLDSPGTVAEGEGPAVPVASSQWTEDGYFIGHNPRFCGEHRTVGEHRAWCFQCAEWCYPDGPCARCVLAQWKNVT